MEYGERRHRVGWRDGEEEVVVINPSDRRGWQGGGGHQSERQKGLATISRQVVVRPCEPGRWFEEEEEGLVRVSSVLVAVCVVRPCEPGRWFEEEEEGLVRVSSVLVAVCVAVGPSLTNEWTMSYRLVKNVRWRFATK
ncbi:hypothetical protein QE152_g4581 [Popillia japonica]|uniref:Uncharacterized protein n=1 Tax=Popillia japonica TaxID=7064 RepID=A0AAW1N245_POPJA